MIRPVYLFVGVFFVGVFYLLLSCLNLEAAGPWPQPKHIKLNGQIVTIGPNSKFIVSSDFLDHFRSAFDAFTDELSIQPVLDDNVPITVEVFSSKIKSDLTEDILSTLNRKEGYWIDVREKGIRIVGADEFGALHGLTTLEKLISSGKGEINQGQILDWPDHKIRALHMVIHRSRPEHIKKLIRLARYGHYNTLVLLLADGVRLNSMEKIARKKAWTKSEFLDIVKLARENGLDVIPEIKLLTHQEQLLKNRYPHLMFNKATYDPRNEKTYNTVLPMIDEVIDLIHPRAVHIGHDEVAGRGPKSRKKWLRKGETFLPPELYLKDVLRIYSYLKKKGLETWMWGDMLLGKKEFSGMLRIHLHGTHGYAALRNRIPGDIVIADWHYFDKQTAFPSASAFAKAGHRVLGATWKRAGTTRNFSRYIADMPSGGEGMIATTWFHVPRKEWNLVEKIIKTSAEAFWNAKQK